jgi:hypothetical protein
MIACVATSHVATSQNSKEKLWLLYVCVFLSLFQFVCLVAVSLFLGEISCPGDFFKTPCDKHKGSFWGK